MVYPQLFSSLGFTLMPLNGKRPAVSTWPSDPKQYPPENITGNYAVILNEKTMVVDVDPRHFVEGDNPIKRLLQLFPLPETTMVKTGGGGLHIFFTKPADIIIQKHLPDYAGLDFLSAGQYVVGAGSVHPETGKQYALASPVAGRIAPAPDALLALLTSPDKGTAEPEHGTAEPDTSAQAKERFLSYLLASAPLAISGLHGDETTFKVAAKGKDLGLSADDTYSLMLSDWNERCVPPWGLEELRTKVANAYEYGKKPAGVESPKAAFRETIEMNQHKYEVAWDVDAKGKIVKTLKNTVNYLITPKYGLTNLLKYNLFTSTVEFVRPAPWHLPGTTRKTITDSDAANLKFHLSAACGYEVSVQLIYEALTVAAQTVSYHPVIDLLKTVEWDRKPRLDTWLIKYLGARDNEYVRAVGRKVLCAAVQRLLQPGCKFDYMLVLEGKQGIGKSTAVSILGGEYYGDLRITIGDKDTIDAMRGRWVIEISELECTRRADTEALKAFVSRQVDRMRPAYARSTEDFPRQSVFIGTINPSHAGYLKDTANRRFWPVMVKQCKFNDFHRDVKQLWAEVFYLQTCLPEVLYLETAELLKQAENEVQARRELDPWAEGIAEYTKGRNEISLKELWESCLLRNMGNMTKTDYARLGAVMTADLHWEKAMTLEGYGFKR
jgi:predicted P-loop ATPase